MVSTLIKTRGYNIWIKHLDKPLDYNTWIKHLIIFSFYYINGDTISLRVSLVVLVVLVDRDSRLCNRRPTK